MMLRPMITKRFLAACFYCFVIILALATVMCLVSFLIESLKSTEPLENNRILKESLLLNNNKLHSRVDTNNELPLQQTAYTEKLTRYKEDPMKRKVVHIKKNHTELKNSDISATKIKKIFPDSDENAFSDTIYIDDFERSKTNMFSFEKIGGYSSQVGKDIFEEKEIESVQTSIPELGSTHTDTIKRLQVLEDDDDNDDSAYGSGSGNFGWSIGINDNPVMEYDNAGLSKDWIPNGRTLWLDPKRFTENYMQKKKYNKRWKAIGRQNSNLHKESTNTLRTKVLWKKPFPIDTDSPSPSPPYVSKFGSKASGSETIRSIAPMKSQIGPKIKIKPDVNFSNNKRKERAKFDYNNKSKTGKLLEIPAKERVVVEDGQFSDRKVLKSIERCCGPKPDQLSYGAFDKLSAKPLDIYKKEKSNDAWVETRTRRVLGNVQKSEERSRQLLLCEEAGGGELCRMLFKGRTSE